MNPATMPTDALLQRIARLQQIQKMNSSRSDAWREASELLAPCFAEMDRRTRAIAAAFIEALRIVLTNAELAVINERNLANDGTCATHDFVDANCCMLDAFRAVLDRDPDPSSESDARLMDDAWYAAREARFSVPDLEDPCPSSK